MIPFGRAEEKGGRERRGEGEGEGKGENGKRLRESTLTTAAKGTAAAKGIGGGRMLSVGWDTAFASGVDKHVCEGKADKKDGLDDEDDGVAGALIAQGLIGEVLLGGHCQRVTCAAWIPKADSSADADGEQTVDEGSLITGGLDAEVHTYEFGRMSLSSSSSLRGRRGSHRSTHYFEPDRGMAVWSIAPCPYDRGLLLVSAGMKHASLFR